MAHITVLVVGDDIGGQLHRVNEGMGGDRHGLGYFIDGWEIIPGLPVKPGVPGHIVAQAHKRDVAFDQLDARDQYEGRREALPWAPTAFVVDGQWHWNTDAVFGRPRELEDQQPPQEIAQREWTAEFRELLAKVPDDATLTLVDCHI